jgi:hypothetical protein
MEPCAQTSKTKTGFYVVGTCHWHDLLSVSAHNEPATSISHLALRDKQRSG